MVLSAKVVGRGVLYLLLATALCGCRGRPGAQGNRVAYNTGAANISGLKVSVLASGSAADELLRKGAQDAVRQYKSELNWSTVSTPKAQAKDVQSEVANKVDGLVLAKPLDAREAESAARSGLTLVDIGNAAKNGNYLAHIVTDYSSAAAALAEVLAKACPQGGTVVFWTEGTGANAEEEKALRAALGKRLPKLTFVTSKPDATSLPPMQAGCKIVIGLSEIASQRARSEFPGIRGRDKKFLIGTGYMNGLGGDLQTGAFLAWIVPDYYRMGFFGVKAVIDHRAGRQVAARLPLRAGLVTKDNLHSMETRRLLQ